MKKLLVLLVLALGFPIVPAATASPLGTLAVTPSAPVVGDSLVFTGCGYSPFNLNKSGGGSQNPIIVTIDPPDGVIQTVFVPTDENGCFTTVGFLTLQAVSGFYSVTAFQGISGKKHQTFLGFTVS